MTSHSIQSPQRPSQGHSTPFVLIADDSVEMRSLLVEILTDTGYEARAVSSGGRAFAEMSQRVPDLLITDLMMPGMNGFALRAEMLRHPKLATVPVIVLSAYWHRPRETLEVAEILPKPLNIDRLLESVRRLTEGPEPLPASSD